MDWIVGEGTVEEGGKGSVAFPLLLIYKRPLGLTALYLPVAGSEASLRGTCERADDI